MKNNENKTIVYKVVKDVVYVGLKVGLVVVEWRVLGKVNSMPLKYFEKFLVAGIIGERVGDHVFNALKRTNGIIKSVKNYRRRRIEEDREKMNEMAKDAQFEWDEAMNKSLNEVINEFKDLGLDIEECQDEIKGNVEKLIKETEQTA